MGEMSKDTGAEIVFACIQIAFIVYCVVSGSWSALFVYGIVATLYAYWPPK